MNKCVLLYKVLQGESPLYIADLLTTNKTVHGRETRRDQSDNFMCQSSVKLWNGLPDEVKRKNSLLSFKNTLKTYFINSYTFEILL